MFSYITYSEFVIRAIQKLGDSSIRFWSRNEIKDLVKETLLTFGAIGQFFKDEILVQLEEDKLFYDITDYKNTNNEKVLGFTTTFGDIKKSVEYVLMRSYNDNIYNIIRDIINIYLLQTGVVLKESLISYEDVNSNTQQISDDIIDIVRLSFRDDSGKYYLLKKEDEDNLRGFYGNYLSKIGRPRFYSQSLQSDNILKIYPKPNISGKLHILSINNIPKDTELNDDTIVPLFVNLTPYIKYGVLAQVFNQDNEFNDVNRKLYCMARFQEGITIGQNYGTILNVELNGVPKSISSIEDVDGFSNNWYNLSKSTPKFLSIVGANIIGTNNVDLSNNISYTYKFNIIKNAIIPQQDNEFLQINSEYVEPLLDYLLHIASLKQGIAKIEATKNNLTDFIALNMQNISRQTKRGTSYDVIAQRSRLQEIQKPRFEKRDAGIQA